MTDDLVPLLVKIEMALRRLGRQVLLESLQGGLPVGAVRSSVEAAGLRSSAELESLFGWRDGTATAGVMAVDDIHIFPGFYLLSLEDALANHKAFAADRRWSAGWLPIFANGAGDFYAADLGPSLAEVPLRHFRIEESEHPIEFSSLHGLLTTLVEAFDRGVIFVDPDGYLEMDDLVFADLAAELNPDVQWWRE